MPQLRHRYGKVSDVKTERRKNQPRKKTETRSRAKPLREWMRSSSLKRNAPVSSHADARENEVTAIRPWSKPTLRQHTSVGIDCSCARWSPSSAGLSHRAVANGVLACSCGFCSPRQACAPKRDCRRESANTPVRLPAQSDGRSFSNKSRAIPMTCEPQRLRIG